MCVSSHVPAQPVPPKARIGRTITDQLAGDCFTAFHVTDSSQSRVRPALLEALQALFAGQQSLHGALLDLALLGDELLQRFDQRIRIAQRLGDGFLLPFGGRERNANGLDVILEKIRLCSLVKARKNLLLSSRGLQKVLSKPSAHYFQVRLNKSSAPYQHALKSFRYYGNTANSARTRNKHITSRRITSTFYPSIFSLTHKVNIGQVQPAVTNVSCRQKEIASL